MSDLANESGLGASRIAIPGYLETVYWWAYVHPRAVRIFEREWLVNLILFGNYARLRDAALNEIGTSVNGKVLQVACVYGDLTQRLHERMAEQSTLDVVDVLPIQLENLQRKIAPDPRVNLWQRDSTALGFDDASYDSVLVFFLLHEQPEAVRRRTLSEVFRVTKPGGKIILVDYHRPTRWNLLRRPLQTLLKRLEPYAGDFWHHELFDYFPHEIELADIHKQTTFGGLYQKMVITR
jgi:ubiquinone/menaquinone biosynthesis C-methylase UbiE